MIAFDTFSWSKVFELEKELGTKLNFKKLPIFLTYELKGELDYFYSDMSDFFKQFPILPTLKTNFSLLKKMGFDEADISLLEYAESKNAIIVTEDHEMLSYGFLKGLSLLQLSDFTIILMREKILDKKEAIKVIKRLRAWKNITKRKFKRIKEIFNFYPCVF